GGAVGAVAAGFAGEDVRMHQRIGVDRGAEVILQAARKMEAVLGGYVFEALQQRGIAAPADFDAAEQIGLGTGHLEQALRLERGFGAEDVAIGLEPDPRAAPVVDLAEILKLALGMAALKTHSI